MVCQKCGIDNPAGTLSCYHCGSPLNKKGSNPVTNPPGKTLGLVGMILGIASVAGAFATVVAPIAGLVLSIIGFKKDKEAGIKNTYAKVGIIINSIVIGLPLLSSIALFIVSIILAFFGMTFNSFFSNMFGSFFDSLFNSLEGIFDICIPLL